VPREGSFNELRNGDYVACRNTKPLIVAFIQLLRQGKKANIKGKEIGRSLINVINKTGQKMTNRLIKHLLAEKIKLKVKLLKKNVKNVEEHEAMILMNERIEIIEILSNGLPTCSMLIEYINRIFLDDKIPGIVLSTIHKLKGLEADRVFVICKELMPSKYAKQDHDKLQEENLEYVLITRARKQLIYVNDFNPDEYEKSLL
jgi:DNA helicase-2/ATP-dependent DNA helicase PcrA